MNLVNVKIIKKKTKIENAKTVSRLVLTVSIRQLKIQDDVIWSLTEHMPRHVSMEFSALALPMNVSLILLAYGKGIFSLAPNEVQGLFQNAVLLWQWNFEPYLSRKCKNVCLHTEYLWSTDEKVLLSVKITTHSEIKNIRRRGSSKIEQTNLWPNS